MRRANLGTGMLMIAVLAWSPWSGHPTLAASEGRGPAPISSVPCPVSHPNGGHPSGQPADRWYHGTGGLWTALWWSKGTVVISPEDVRRNGRLYFKVGWWRGPGSHGKLRIQGRRLDRPAPALRADVPSGYGPSGFQPSALLFPTTGCWQVTGRAGRGRLTIVMRVVKGKK